MANSFKQQVVSGVLWDGFQKFGTMTITFVSNIILARLLMPEDFGTLGLIMVFIAISNAFVDSGFTSALIQKGNPTNEDYSSVFFFNLTLSIVFYSLIYILSPSFSQFFHAPLLTETLRVTGIILIINAISIIQLTQLQITLQFKKRSQYNILATLIGTTLGIILAFYDFGVWSLVYRTIVTSMILCLMVWIKGHWVPILRFSFQRVRSLFNFGGFIFFSTLIEYAYSNLQPILIGKFFTLGQLGYFTQARKLEEIPTNTITGIVTTVTFPVYSKIKDDKDKIIGAAKKSLSLLSFVSIPLMTLIIILAHPLVLACFGEKWEESYKYLQILCIAGFFRIPSGINMSLIKSIGKSKSFMYIQLIKRIVGIIFILLGVQFGIMGLMWGFAFSSFAFFVIDSTACGYFMNYGTISQLKAMWPNIAIAVVSAIGVLLVDRMIFNSNSILIIIIDSIIFSVLVFVLSSLLHTEAQRYLVTIIKEKFFS